MDKGNKDPFNFDISISSFKKRKQKNYNPAAEDNKSKRICDHEGCNREGKFRAPKSSDWVSTEYYWFCRKHVVEYNNQWNFNNHELSRRNTLGKRSADYVDRNLFGKQSKAESEILAAAHGLSAAQRAQSELDNKSRHRLTINEQRALDILMVTATSSKAEIRKSYNNLIKDLHPDLNGGTRCDEERLQEVRWAWDKIKNSKNF